jgi:3-deoxy-7-phosphoheptulonate synthase
MILPWATVLLSVLSHCIGCDAFGYRTKGLSISGFSVHQRSNKGSALMGAASRWAAGSWRNFRVEQLPEYPVIEETRRAENVLASSAPLVFAGEMRQLQQRLAQAQQGNGFLLMGGDCAESFDEFSTDHIRDTLRVILQMALTITYGASKPVIKVGRMAGVFFREFNM